MYRFYHCKVYRFLRKDRQSGLTPFSGLLHNITPWLVRLIWYRCSWSLQYKEHSLPFVLLYLHQSQHWPYLPSKHTLQHESNKFRPNGLHTTLYGHLSSACFLRPVCIFYNGAMDTIDVKYLSIKVFLLRCTNVIFDHNKGQEGYWFSSPGYCSVGFPCTSSYPMLNHA